jgi:hypothetical protein
MNPALALPRRGARIGIQTWLWRASVSLLCLAFLACVHLYTMADPDLWGHLRFGLDILEARAIPTHDTYSFTAHGAPWINHEWLSELLFALVWQAAGAAGLVWLKIALALSTIAIVFSHLRRQGVTTGLAALVLLPWTMMVPAFTLIRPLHFTIPCFAALLAVLYETNHERPRALWLLTPLFALWANLHGGVLAGAAVLLLWLAGQACFHRELLRRAWFPALCALAALCANPYGWGLLEFLLRTATVHRPEIIEWAPLRATSPNGIPYLLFSAAAVLGLVRSRLPRPAPLLILFAAILTLPFAAIRHASLAYMAILILAGPHIADAACAWMDTRRPSAPWSLPAWSFLLPLALSGVLAVTVLAKPHAIEIPKQKFPVQAVRVLSAAGIAGNLINRFNWGEYLIWHLAPQVRVAIDGRRETIYSPPLYQKYRLFEEGNAGWDWLLKEYPADVAVVERELVSATRWPPSSPGAVPPPLPACAWPRATSRAHSRPHSSLRSPSISAQFLSGDRPRRLC